MARTFVCCSSQLAYNVFNHIAKHLNICYVYKIVTISKKTSVKIFFSNKFKKYIISARMNQKAFKCMFHIK